MYALPLWRCTPPDDWEGLFHWGDRRWTSSSPRGGRPNCLYSDNSDKANGCTFFSVYRLRCWFQMLLHWPRLPLRSLSREGSLALAADVVGNGAFSFQPGRRDDSRGQAYSSTDVVSAWATSWRVCSFRENNCDPSDDKYLQSTRSSQMHSTMHLNQSLSTLISLFLAEIKLHFGGCSSWKSSLNYSMPDIKTVKLEFCIRPKRDTYQ